MPDLANAGALEVLDPYVDKYGYRDELQKIAPTYRDNQMKVGDKIFGFPTTATSSSCTTGRTSSRRGEQGRVQGQVRL